MFPLVLRGKFKTKHKLQHDSDNLSFSGHENGGASVSEGTDKPSLKSRSSPRTNDQTNSDNLVDVKSDDLSFDLFPVRLET